MHWLKGLSIFVLIIGIILLTLGLIFLYTNKLETKYISVLLVTGLLLMLSSIIMLGVSLEYDRKSPYEQVKEYIQQNG